MRRGGSTYTATSSPELAARGVSTIATTRGALRARSSPVAPSRSAISSAAQPQPVGARPADRRLERAGAAGDDDVQASGRSGSASGARSARRVSLTTKPPTRAAYGASRCSRCSFTASVEGHVAGREDGGVVDQRDRGTRGLSG